MLLAQRQQLSRKGSQALQVRLLDGPFKDAMERDRRELSWGIANCTPR